MWYKFIGQKDMEMGDSPIPDKWHQLIDIMGIEELLKSTRELVSEQRVALNIVLAYCRDLRKSWNRQEYSYSCNVPMDSQNITNARGRV